MRKAMKREDDDFARKMAEETERRIAVMRSPSYEYPKRATRVDWALIGAIVFASAVLAFLSMVGVIA